MSNIETNVPIQRNQNIWIKFVKGFLKTQVGKHIAFTLGIKGFDRVGYSLIKFKGYDKNGEKVYAKPSMFNFSYNSRVNKGAAQQASLMSGSTLGGITTPLPAIYIALSTASLTPAYGDTTLTSETVVAGIARALGTVQNYVSPGTTVDGAASYDIYKQFTLTGSGTTVVSSALLDAASTGNLFAEANFGSSAVMATNDILQVTWTVNI
jgi:hypothetical protein